MSSIGSGSDPSDPNDPLHYAPRAVRSKASPQARQVRPVRPMSVRPVSNTRSTFDEMLNDAVAKSRRHPLDPVAIYEPEKPRARFRVAGGFAAAIGVAAIIGVVYFMMSGKSQGSDPAPVAAANAAESHQDSPADSADSQALLQKFVQFGKSQDNPAAQPAPDDSQALLQKFMQWKQKQQ